MITGNIQDLHLHLSPEVSAIILQFIREGNVERYDPGKYPLDKGINAIIIKTKSRNISGQQFEAHRWYLDLHYLHEGRELLAFASAHGLRVSQAYDEEGDYKLYHPPQQYSQINLNKSQFTLFQLEDAHCAQGHLDEQNELVKCVFKIPISTARQLTSASVKIVPVVDIDAALPTLWDHDQKNQVINFPNSSPNPELFKRNIRQETTHENASFFFVYEEQKVVGSLGLRMKENPYRRQKYGEIWYIFLEPECRGKGIGRILLDFADNYFQERGCSYTFAGISAFNPASNKLFESAGYTKTRFILEKEYYGNRNSS